ncbi:MAG: hypothetical protein K9G41_12160 [Flavobacteriales bacterium]|nr:hypothetical protein [Flavobacteriales bacterium]
MDYTTFSFALANLLNIPTSIFDIDLKDEIKLPTNSEWKYPLEKYEPHKFNGFSIIKGYHYSRRPDQGLEWISLHYSVADQDQLLRILNDILNDTEELGTDENGDYDYVSTEGLRLSGYKCENGCRLDVIRKML